MKYIALLSAFFLLPGISVAAPSLVYSTMVLDTVAIRGYASDVDLDGNMYLVVTYGDFITVYCLDPEGTDVDTLTTIESGNYRLDKLLWRDSGIYVHMESQVLKLNFAGDVVYTLSITDRYSPLKIIVDEQGYIYSVLCVDEELAGDITTTPDALDSSYNGEYDIVIQKYDPDGNLIYSTFLGGSANDMAGCATSDDEGRLYIGAKVSPDLPYQMEGEYPLSYDNDCLIVLSLELSKINVYYTESMESIIVAKNDAIYEILKGAIHKRSETGEVQWAMSLGGGIPYIWWPPAKPAANNDDYASLITQNNLLSIQSVTYYDPFTVTPDALYDTVIGGNRTLGIWQFTEEEELLYGTYFGGEGDEETRMNAVVYRDGRLYVSGLTNSTQFPLTPGAYIDAREHQFPTHGLFAFCIDFNESTGVADKTDTAPAPLALDPPHPNPFNPQTTLSFTLPEAGFARLAVYNLGGQLVRELAAETLPAGQHEIVWDGRDSDGAAVASGIYIARLAAGGRSAVRKVTLVR